MLLIDPDGMAPDNDYVFNKDGKFTGEIRKTNDTFHRIIQQNADGTESVYKFNDSKNDSKSLELNATYDSENKILNNKTEKDIDSYMSQSNIEPKGFLEKYSFANNELHGRKMDFAVLYLSDELSENGFSSEEIDSDSAGFFLVGDTAYNNHDFGNFLWGHAMSILGFYAGTAEIAAHVNNATKDDNPGILDSASDQKAIREGYKYGKTVDTRMHNIDIKR